MHSTISTCFNAYKYLKTFFFLSPIPVSNIKDVQKSMRGMYSSNDSGFSNEMAPVAPEVDYSDDEIPQKVPIR